MGYPVNPPSEQVGVLTAAQISNLTTTRQKISLPSGAVTVTASYRLLPGATAVTGQYAKVALNASSDADADGKLANAGSHIVLCQGDDLVVSAESADPITRVDVVAAQAVGAEVTMLQIIAGVQP